MFSNFEGEFFKKFKRMIFKMIIFRLTVVACEDGILA